MVDDGGDFFSVTLECCHNLFLILVKHHHILVCSTFTTQKSQRQVYLKLFHTFQRFKYELSFETDQFTSENFACVRGTQIQCQDSRNTGTMETLKFTKRETTIKICTLKAFYYLTTIKPCDIR